MVVMTKVKGWDEGKREEWRKECWPCGKESATKVERLKEQLGREAERKRTVEKDGGVGEGNKTSKKKRRAMWGVERNQVTVRKFKDDEE